MASRSLAFFNLPGVTLPGFLNKLRFDAWSGKVNLLFFLCAVVIVASLFLGGGTRAGYLSDAILQLLAIPLLLASLWRLPEVPLTRHRRRALLFCLAIAVLPLIQLIPLPPWLWTALPNRQLEAETFQLIGDTVPWMPISASPRGTWLSALSLLPPIAIFLGTLLASYRERRLLSLVFLVVGVISVFVGLLQVAQGQESPLRFFAITNPTEAVGFFANRNHYAALLYCLMLFVIVWTLDWATLISSNNKNLGYDTTSILALIGGFTVLVLFFAGEVMARSRAGLGLTIMALFGAIALGFPGRAARSGVPFKRLLFGAIALAVTFSLQFAFYRVVERFSDPLQDDRQVIAYTTIDAAKANMPMGSGLGTFVPVYATFEKPEKVSSAYVNHAHNDILEVWLETGVFGLALMGLFVFWLVRRSVEIWRSPPANGASALDWSLARAATLVAALIVAHSFLDYPLRTSAMMAVMVFSCALLIEPPIGAESRDEQESVPKRTGHRYKRKLEPPTPVLRKSISMPESTASVQAVSPDRRWGTDLKWPNEWSRPPKPSSAGDNDLKDSKPTEASKPSE